MVYLTGGHPRRHRPLQARQAALAGANGIPWWYWATLALCGTAARRNRKSWIGCASARIPCCFWTAATKTTTFLKQYPTEERFGGKVQALGGNVYHVCRGSVLELENKKYLCFGGAESQDVEDREPGVNWWREEMPSEEEYAFCEEKPCSVRLQSGLCADPRCAKQTFWNFTALASGETNQLHSFLDKILLKLTYDKWLFLAATIRIPSFPPKAAACSAM